METSKQICLHNPQGLRSIYVCHSRYRYGIAVGATEDIAFQEQPRSIEIWKKEGSALQLVKRFHKRHVIYAEYDDQPFMWVRPRPFSR